MSDDPEWKPDGSAVPTRTRLTEEQIDRVKAHLWSVGITDDPFAMDPVRRLAWLSEFRERAAAVYAAIKVEVPDRLLQGFGQWCKDLGLPW